MGLTVFTNIECEFIFTLFLSPEFEIEASGSCGVANSRTWAADRWLNEASTFCGL